jgi:hypothetical protein
MSDPGASDAVTTRRERVISGFLTLFEGQSMTTLIADDCDAIRARMAEIAAEEAIARRAAEVLEQNPLLTVTASQPQTSDYEMCLATAARTVSDADLERVRRYIRETTGVDAIL